MGRMNAKAKPRGQRFWLLKTEPSDYSIDDLERDAGTVWDGVSNNAALKHIREVAKGDRALVYHTGGERAAVGIGRMLMSVLRDVSMTPA
jgi:predicted RNA-binding protein with PUA-like domain